MLQNLRAIPQGEDAGTHLDRADVNALVCPQVCRRAAIARLDHDARSRDGVGKGVVARLREQERSAGLHRRRPERARTGQLKDATGDEDAARERVVGLVERQCSRARLFKNSVP